MISPKLSQAISLIKAGNKQAAYPILRQLIQEEPNNEQGWLWMFACADRPEQKRYCLQKALEINPNNNDARKALEKLSGNIPTPTPVEPTRPKIQQSPVYQQLPAARPQGKTLQPSSKKQPASSRNMLLIGGAIVALFLCVSIGFGGNWIYRNYFASEQPYANEPQASSPDNNPMNTGNDPTNPNQGTDDGGSFPTPIIVEPGNESAPTATVDGDYGIRIIPVSYTKVPTEEDPKWSRLNIVFAVENHSEESRIVNMPVWSKVRTQQGFEYGCEMTYGLRVILPPKFRYKVIGECRVPTDSSGYNVSLDAGVRKLNLQGLANSESKIGFDLNIEQQNTNLTYPLFDREFYNHQQQIPFYAPNQLVELPDLTFSYFPSPDKDGGQTISIRVQNKSVGSNIRVLVSGSLFMPDGSVLGFEGLAEIEIGGSAEFALKPVGSRPTLPGNLSNSCFFVDGFYVQYYTSSLNTKPEIPIFYMICF